MQASRLVARVCGGLPSPGLSPLATAHGARHDTFRLLVRARIPPTWHRLCSWVCCMAPVLPRQAQYRGKEAMAAGYEYTRHGGKLSMVENSRAPLLYAALSDAIHHHLKYSLGKSRENCSQGELFLAVGLALRDRLVDHMWETEARYHKTEAKRLYYLSMEFLIGRSLDTNLANMGIVDLYRELLEEMGVELED